MTRIALGARRPYSKPEERRQWAQRFYQSWRSQADFALRHGLGLSTLQRWLKEHPKGADAPVFAEVKLPQASARWAAELVHSDGTVLRLAHDVPTSLLAQLLPPC